MLTFFTTAKPFEGHSGIIQRNALQSWKLLHPDVEVILFGDENGVASVCAEYGLRHEPQVLRHGSGMKYLDYLFAKAQKLARHEYLCYSNCDIIFLSDFYKAFVGAAEWKKQFLMVGQRWDTDITEPIDFDNPDWSKDLRMLAQKKGFRQKMHFVDYFVFSKGLYDEVPPLLIGRSFWDHWLVWKALSRQAPVVDCTRFVVAIHQNHGYAYHPQGKDGTNEDELAKRNIALAGMGRHLRFTADATHVVTRRCTIRRTPFRRFTSLTVPNMFRNLIFKTFWIRKRLGLRRENLNRLLRHKERPQN